MIEVTWFWLLGFMLATYVVLDGFDLGAGILHLWIGKNDAERRQIIRSVGPVWDGNEVWLLASAGTLIFTFPLLYATAFSGFYLPLMIVLWLLMGRALGIEMRHQMDDVLWKQFWDVIFTVSSFLLVVFYGAALGNIVRGVPLKEDGKFFEALWTDFRIGPDTGILDWYTILVGLTALVLLTYHGALWLHWRTDGAVFRRSGQWAQRLGPAALAFWIITIYFSFHVQPQLKENLGDRKWGALFPALSVAAMIGSYVWHRAGRRARAFVASCIMLYAMLGSAAAGIYPYILPARDPANGLTIFEAAASKHGLLWGFSWWIPGIVLVFGYTYFIYSKLMSGTISVDAADGH